MKNQEQFNNNNNLNDPTAPNDPQPLVEDLTISGEQEERLKGGAGEAIKRDKWIDVLTFPYNRGNSASDDKLMSEVVSFEIK